MGPEKTPTTKGSEVRIGLLGAGFMGKCHTNAFSRIPLFYPDSGVRPRLAMLCAGSEDSAARGATALGYEEYTSDWRDLVEDDRIDILDNCGPDPLHPEPCLEALRNGKHVICEKPMALTIEAAREMRAAAAASPAKAMVVFNNRFIPAVRFARDLITSGRLGRLYHMRVQYLQPYGHDPSLAPDDVWYSAWPHSGILQGIGAHAIDQCRYLAGEIKSVSAVVKAFQETRAVPTVGGGGAVSDEANAAIFEFENGATGVLESSGLVAGRHNYLAWEINGSEGSLKWDLEHPNSLFACMSGVGEATLSGFAERSVTSADHPEVGAWWPPGHNLGWEHAHTIEKFHFLDAVANRKELSPHNATFEDGYRVAVIVDAMRKSSASGRRVDLDFS